MRFLDYLLNSVLQEYQEIIVYGAGWFAQQIYPILSKYKLQERIICFAVSKLKEEKWFEESEIKEFNDIQCDKSKVVVLIAVADVHIDEIIVNTQKAGYKNIIVAANYIRSHKNMKKLYQSFSYEQFIDCIVEKHMYDNSDETKFSSQIKGKAIYCHPPYDFNGNEIVYITGQLLPRNIKMIAALKKQKYNVVVIIYGQLKCGVVSELYQLGISYTWCADEEEVTFQALKYRPLVYYYQPAWGNCIWLEILMQYKKYFRPIVVGLYDVLNDGCIIEDSDLLSSEKYVLENADGVVWRWFSKEYLEKQKGFLYGGKSIEFHDYCGGYIKGTKEKKDNEKVLKLCNVQGLFAYFSQKGDVPDGYETFSSLDDITNALGNKENCILDFFIGHYSQDDFEKAKKIEDRYTNIRFFWEIDHLQLVNRLQDYDYGCDFFNEGKEIPMDMPILCGSSEYYGSEYVNSESHRFYDFIDAGIPVVTIMPRKQVDFLDKYGAVVRMSLQRLDIDFLQEHKEEWRQKAVLARQELDIDRHIDKLIQFFKDL